MARPRAHEIQDTPLTWAIRSIRRRLGLGQIAFTNLVLDRPSHSLLSRWESGQLVPSIENLLRLFRVAETPQEQRPILEALKIRGIHDLVASLQPYLAKQQPAAAAEIPDSADGRGAPAPSEVRQ